MQDLSLTIAPSVAAPPPSGPRPTGGGGFAERLARAETQGSLSSDTEPQSLMPTDGSGAASFGMTQPGLAPLRMGPGGMAGADQDARPPGAEPWAMIPGEAVGNQPPAEPPLAPWPPGSFPAVDAVDGRDEQPPPDDAVEADFAMGDGTPILAPPMAQAPLAHMLAADLKALFGGPTGASTQGATDEAPIGAARGASVEANVGAGIGTTAGASIAPTGQAAAGSTDPDLASGTGPALVTAATPDLDAPDLDAPDPISARLAQGVGGGLAGDAELTTRADTGAWPLGAPSASSPVPEAHRPAAWTAASAGSASASPLAAELDGRGAAMIRQAMTDASGSSRTDGATLGTAPADAQGPAAAAANANRQTPRDDPRAGPAGDTVVPEPSRAQSFEASGAQSGGQGLGEPETAPDAPPLAEAPSTGEALPFPQSPATAATPAPASPAPSTTRHGPAPVAEQLTPAIARMETGPDGVRRLTIRLEPVELGQLEIRIERAGDQAPRVHLMVERPETLALLRRDQPALERALDQAGLAAEGREIVLQLAPPEVRPVTAAATADPRTANGDPMGAFSPGDSQGGSPGGEADRQAGQRRGGRDPLPFGGMAGPTDPRQPPWRRVGLDITA